MEVGNLVVRLTVKTDEFQKGLSKTQASLKRLGQTLSQPFTAAAAPIRSLAGKLTNLQTVIGGIIAGTAAKGAWNWLVSGNAQMEQYRQTLAIVLKDQQKAVEALAWAQKFAAKTPFEIPDIVEATTRLSAYGITAQDVLGDIGDMAAAMGKPLMQAVEAIADAQTGELERLKEFGITKQMLIDQAAKMGMQEIVNAKGQITDMEGLNKALIAIIKDRYHGAMEAQSTTLNGMISNLKDWLGTAGRVLGEGIFERVKPSLQNLLNYMNQLTESGKLDEWAAKVAVAIDKAIEVIINVGKAIKDIAGFIIDNWSKIAPIVSGVVAAFVAFKTITFVKDLIIGLRVAFAALNLVMVANPIGLVVAAIGLLVAAGVALYQNWDIIKAKAQQLWAAISQVWVNIKATISAVWTEAVQWGVNIVQGIINGITSMVGRVRETAQNIVASVKNAIKGFLGIASPSQVMIEFGQAVSEGLAQGIEQRASRVKDAAQKLADDIRNVADTMVSKLSAAMSITEKEFKLQEMRLKMTATETQKLDSAKRLLIQTLGMTADEVKQLTEAYADDKQKLLELGWEAERAAIQKQNLSRQLANAQQQVEVLTVAYEKMVLAQGANSQAAMDLKSKLLDAQIAVTDYSQQLIDINKNLADSARSVADEYENMRQEVSKEPGDTGKKSISSKKSKKEEKKKGWRYLDKYGIEHVVEDKATAEKYGQPGTIEPYEGKYGGGYALQHGGVIKKPTWALMGETPAARPEIVSPVNLLKSVFKNALSEFTVKSAYPIAGATTGGNIIIQNMHVRSDQDIERVAQRLWQLQQSRARGQGR